MRVLFVAEAVTLAHVARVHALARQLDPLAYDICIAADPRYDELIGRHRFTTHQISSISTARFSNALATGSAIYDVETLEAYVTEDLRVIAAFAPDVVVGDFRLSLTVSARLAGKPYVNVAGANWSPYANVEFTVPDIALTRFTGVRVAQMLFGAARSIAFRSHAKPVNDLRRRHGMPFLSNDLRVIYTDADFVLYADVPELFDMRPLPPNEDFVGAVLWSPESSLPDWWDDIPTNRPIVYVTLGSSGDVTVLSTVLAAFAELPVTVVAATAGRVQAEAIEGKTYVANYLPGTLAAQRAHLVVCNGGSATCYQALAAGVPILGIPSNLDQFLTMGAIQAAGAGTMLRTQGLSTSRVRKAAEGIQATTGFRTAAGRIKTAIEGRSNASMLSRTLAAAVGRAFQPTVQHPDRAFRALR